MILRRSSLVGLCSSISVCAVLCLCDLSSAERHAGSRARPRRGRCQLEFWEYFPSALEQAWSSNIDAWKGQEYCERTAQYESNITFWLQATNELMLSTRTRLRQPEQGAVFSSFVSTFNCNGKLRKQTSWIEPLAFSLRYPTAPCNRSAIEGRDYLLLASTADAKLQPDRSPRAYLFDMGASTWAQGEGGASQSFLIDAYKRRGIAFDRILLWEAQPYTIQEIYNKVPRELHGVYQYMNFPVSPAKDDPGNPLNIIKAITKPGDFVAVKLDIDAPAIEDQLIEQVLADPELYQRIDELFFEQHVNFQPMLPNWKTVFNPDKTLADSYKLFAQLRRRGIRAHGWP